MKANTTYELTASDFCQGRLYSGSRACTLGWMEKLSIKDVVSENKFVKVWQKEANKAGVGNKGYLIPYRNDNPETTKKQLATVFNNTMAALGLEIVDV